MLYLVLAGLSLVQEAPASQDVTSSPEATASSEGTAIAGPLAQIAGDWQVVNTQARRISNSCAQAQRFVVAPDGQSVTLTEVGNNEWSARYLVLLADRTRLLMRIENEERLTEGGAPVRWWAQFNGPDEFRWRRDDWPRRTATPAVWRRCSAS